MKVAERAGVTDPGRRRRRNEDAFVLDPPLFVIADGMGGAQAGEVASRLAAAAFREYHDADDLEPEARIAAIIQEANRRIYERSRADAETSGMGTTITAALFTGEAVTIGHVGDSRAYRLRDGELEQLTHDHSLVGDLIRSGRLSPEEARSHPQRSVITRALGTDQDVDVDSFTVDPRTGDVYMLCSDGLTDMVADEEIVRILHERKTLERAAKELVRQANRRGGDDNVTVILFTVEEGASGIEETAPLSANGRGEADDLEDTLSGLEVPTHIDPAPDTVVTPPTEPAEAGWTAVEETSPRRAARPPARERRGPRRLILVLLALLLVAVLVLLALWGLSNAHFVGAEDAGRVAVYQGLPYDLAPGVSLYRARYVSDVRAAQLSQAERIKLFDHELMSYDDARARVERYEPTAVP
jgi:PPM family protein phosphatase